MEVMMKNCWPRSDRRVALEVALTPTGDRIDEGRLEQLAANQQATAEALGRLLAWQVENGRMRLEVAAEIAGFSGDLVEIPDTGE